MRNTILLCGAIAMSTASCDGIESFGSIESSSSGSVVFTGTISGNAFVSDNATGAVNVWEVWNVGNYVAQPMPNSPYSLTSALGCTYALTN